VPHERHRTTAISAVFSPLAFPFQGNAAGRWINRKVLRWSLLRVCGQLGLRNPITWVFIPASAEVARALGERTLVYQMHKLPNFPDDASQIRNHSTRLRFARRCMMCFLLSGLPSQW